MIFLASPGVAPPPSADEWIARHAARGLETDFVTPPAIRERLTTDRIGQAREAFARSGARINRDGRPIACHYQFVRWLRSFHPRAADLAGSCLAALLIGLWALPVLGSGATLALLAALNAAVAGIAFRGDPAWDIRSGGR